MAGTKQQGIAMLAPVHGNGESWNRECGTELNRFGEMRTRHAHGYYGPDHSSHIPPLRSGRRGAVQQRSQSGQSGHDYEHASATP
jgi:hypothetical protein